MPMSSEPFNDALMITAIVDEMARADNWQGIDECLAFRPEHVKDLTRYADAALRVMKRRESSKKSGAANLN